MVDIPFINDPVQISKASVNTLWKYIDLTLRKYYSDGPPVEYSEMETEGFSRAMVELTDLRNAVLEEVDAWAQENPKAVLSALRMVFGREEGDRKFHERHG